MVTPRREASPTVGFIDNYCQAYQNLFSDVRNYEAFKLLLFKPKKCLKAEDTYGTKPQLAVEIIKELQKCNFKIKLVLADSLEARKWGCNYSVRGIESRIYRGNSLQS